MYPIARVRPPARQAGIARVGESATGTPPNAADTILPTPCAMSSRLARLRVPAAASIAAAASSESSEPMIAMTAAVVASNGRCRTAAGWTARSAMPANAVGSGRPAAIVPTTGPSAPPGTTNEVA